MANRVKTGKTSQKWYCSLTATALLEPIEGWGLQEENNEGD